VDGISLDMERIGGPAPHLGDMLTNSMRRDNLDVLVQQLKDHLDAGVWCLCQQSDQATFLRDSFVTVIQINIRKTALSTRSLYLACMPSSIFSLLNNDARAISSYFSDTSRNDSILCLRITLKR
jgi:hypothetical protein